MKAVRFIVTLLVALTVVMTACSPQVTPAAAPPAAIAMPTAAPTAAAVSGTTINLGKNDKLGSFLVDDKGMTLYLFTKDTPNTSNCYDKCATAWPPLFTTGKPIAGTGVDATKLGTTARKDGSLQVTYNGWPLYYYVKDTKTGDVVGQDVGNVWFLISSTGEQVQTPTAAAIATVNLGKSDKFGPFLVDVKGMTLYLFTKDVPNTSNCYDKCATAWPPLLATDKPVAGTGVDATKLGTTARKDGSLQVTYNGWPLYYYVKDTKTGDVVGQDVGNVWFLISSTGEQVQTPTAAAIGTVSLGKSDKFGPFLVDAKGMTLYLFTKDVPNTSNCYDKCATAWPPLLATDKPVAGTGVDATKLGTTARKDGSLQVTYNGWPLYYYVKDTKTGDVVGQDVGNVWYVVSPAGDQITAQ